MLDYARERTAGPTLLRAYIDCRRAGPLASNREMKSALAASDQCVSSFPDTPFPRLLRGMIKVHDFDSNESLISGADELISVFSDYPDIFQTLPFNELASVLRGLSAAGESGRKAALLKAYFSPLYIPSPSPTSDVALLSGIGELLDSGDVALASRLAGFLQSGKGVLGLLSFKPVKSIWPVLETRHAQGYDAAQTSWKMLEKNLPDFGFERIALLAALDRWDQIESESQSAINQWDGKDGNAQVVNFIGAASGSLWDADLHERSIALSTLLINKADETASGQLPNLGFNAGFRMIQIGQDKEGRALIKSFIAEVEDDPEAIEWQSGNAFLDALRVCVSTGDEAARALTRINQATGDLYSQKAIAYECNRDEKQLANLIAENLRSGAMVDRLNLAISFAPIFAPHSKRISPTFRSAIQNEPLKSAIDELFRHYPGDQ